MIPPKPITPKDIDREIELMGIRLSSNQDALRKRVLYQLQLRRRKEADWANSVPPIPMFLLDKY